MQNLVVTLLYVYFISVFILFSFYRLQGPEYKEHIIAFMLLSSACMIFAFVQGMQSSALENFVEFNTNQVFIWYSYAASNCQHF